jgi:hypothetical protein
VGIANAPSWTFTGVVANGVQATSYPRMRTCDPGYRRTVDRVYKRTESVGRSW